MPNVARLGQKRTVFKGGSWVEPTGAIVFFDDFLGKAFNATDMWTTTQVGTSIPATPAHDGDAGDPVAGAGGWLAMGSDDVDDKSSEIALVNESVKGQFTVSRAGNGFLVFESVVSSPTALTTRTYNIGFSDDESESTGTLAMQFDAGDVITATANDACAFSFSSLATTPAWRGISVNATVVGTATAARTAVADTATKLRIEIDSGGNAFFYIRVPPAATIYPRDPLGHANQMQEVSGAQIPDFLGSQALAVATTLDAIPYIGTGATTTTSSPLELDYVFVACAR